MSYPERTYGKQYDGHLTTTQIAARLRADVKQAQTRRTPTIPRTVKVSIRTEYFSGGSAIRVNVTAVPASFAILNPEHVRWQVERPSECHPHDLHRYTPEAEALCQTLQTMMNSYNHDGSDSMTDHFDVKFYGHAGFDHALEHAEWQRLTAAVRAETAVAS